MSTRGIWFTLLFVAYWMLSAASHADQKVGRKQEDRSRWNGEFELIDVNKTNSETMWKFALPSEREKIATFHGYRREELCRYLSSEIGKKIVDWDLRFVATADANRDADESAFKAKSLIDSTDEVPLVSTVTDKCQQFTDSSRPMLIVTNHLVPGKDADFALWTDNPFVLKELSAGWVDLGSQINGEWTRKYFDWDDTKSTPEVGDWVEATRRSHIYADYLRYHGDLDLWVGGPIVTVVRSGDRYHVDAVIKEPRGGGIWAKISPL